MSQKSIVQKLLREFLAEWEGHKVEFSKISSSLKPKHTLIKIKLNDGKYLCFLTFYLEVDTMFILVKFFSQPNLPVIILQYYSSKVFHAVTTNYVFKNEL